MAAKAGFLAGQVAAEVGKILRVSAGKSENVQVKTPCPGEGGGLVAWAAAVALMGERPWSPRAVTVCSPDHRD
jgi:hypothetical protein